MNTIKKVISFTETEIICETDDGKKVKRVGGTLSWRHNNPGNLIFTKFSRDHGAITKGLRNLSIFPTFWHGDIAQRQLVFGTQREYHKMSIADAIAKYAPEYDNNDPVKYADFLAKQIGVPKTNILNDMNDVQKSLMIASMQRYEGFRVGQIITI